MSHEGAWRSHRESSWEVGCVPDLPGVPIGDSYPVYVVAEAADTHMGSLASAMEIASAVKATGADAVKFQHHIVDEEMLRDVPRSSNMAEPLDVFLDRVALTIAEHETLAHHCHRIGITYLCTPFSWTAAEELARSTINLPAYKIGSGELTDLPYLQKVARLGKPMIVSTGMSDWAEVDLTYRTLTDAGVALCLTHCTSEYPPVYADINLAVIPLLKERYPRAVVGHSDHTRTIYTALGAVALGARLIEKHVTPDPDMPGPDQEVSLSFAEFSDLVEGIRAVEAAMGAEKMVHPREAEIRAWATRSLVTTRAFRAGEAVTTDGLWSKRPGTGIPSSRLEEVVGKRLRRDVPANHLLAWGELEDDAE